MLTFNVKKIWFDKIKSGKKTHEYREVKPYWTDRIMRGMYHEYITNDAYFISMCNGGQRFWKPLDNRITFMNGMFSEKIKPRLYAEMKSIKIVNGLNTDLKINQPVYDIEFELIKDKEQKHDRCPYLKNGRCHCWNTLFMDKDDKPVQPFEEAGRCDGKYENCHFKQNQKLKQENEKLKEQIIKAIKDAQNFKDLYFWEKQKIERIDALFQKLKQENEELRQVRKNTPDIQEPYVILYRQLKKENARLLKVINEQPLKTIDMDSAFEIAKLKQENEELKKKLAYLTCNANCHQYKRAEKLQQKLEKIKDYITDDIDRCSDCKNLDKCRASNLDDILQITESEDE